jgi:hypothetical protein
MLERAAAYSQSSNPEERDGSLSRAALSPSSPPRLSSPPNLWVEAVLRVSVRKRLGSNNGIELENEYVS